MEAVYHFGRGRGMAVTITCPRCTHKNSVDDAQATKAVHCRICHFVLAPGTSAAAPSAAPSTPATPSIPVLELVAEGPPQGLVKEGPPPSTKPRRAEDTRREETRPAPPPRRPSRRDRDDEDDDRRRPSRRPAPASGGGSIAVWLLGGFAVLLVLGCCVTSGVAYLFFAAAEQPVVEVVVGPPAQFNPPPQFNPQPPNNFNPPPIFVPPPPPQPVRLNPQDPNDADKAIAMLKQGGNDFNEACRWFRSASVDHPARDRVAKALEAELEQQKRQQFGHHDYWESYFRWATKDNFPSLLAMVQDGDFGRIQRRHKAIETLGRLKDARAAEPLLQRLPEIHDRFQATRALEELGPAALPTLVKHLNDANRDVRDAARNLIKKQNPEPDTILTQTLADLIAADDQVRAAALEWLGQMPVNEKRQPEVAKTLDGLIQPGKLQGPMLKALQIWGTSDNAVTIAKNLDPNAVFEFRDQVQLLVKFKDPRTVPALTSHLGRAGLPGIEVHNALKQFGNVAEPEVIKVLRSPDGQVRMAACRLLGDIGTAKVAIPALQLAVQANPNDRQFAFFAGISAKAIMARGGK
jgi:HEAT repeat protein